MQLYKDNLFSRFRFEELGSLAFMIPIFLIIISKVEPYRLIRDAEKQSLLIAFLMLIIYAGRFRFAMKSKTLQVVRDFAPLYYVLVIYSNLPQLINTLNSTDADIILIKIDQLLFGMQLSVYTERFLWAPLVTFATISYATYYFFPLALAILFYLNRTYKAFRELSAAILLSFFVGYIGYVLVPATGPRYNISDQYSAQIEGSRFSQLIRQKLDDWEYTKRDCFPSLHNAVILISLLFAFRYARWFSWLFLPFALGLFFATIYLRYHYLIDVVAGWTLAVLSYYLGPRILHHWEGKALPFFKVE